MAAAGITLDDWDEILDLGGLTRALAYGDYGPERAREILAARRAVYPGVQLDYVRVLDAFGQFVDKVGEALDKQNDALDAYNENVSQYGAHFDFDRSRLLTQAERDAFSDFQIALDREVRKAAEEANGSSEDEEADAEIDDPESEAEDIQNQMDDLQGQIDDLQDTIDEAEAEWGD